MKAKLTVFIVIILTLITWNSCKEEDANLDVTITSLGYNNSHIGYLGGALGVSAGILAEKEVDNIEIGIRPENGNLRSGYNNADFFSAWLFDSVYTDKYSGETETTFNEDILIPLDADTGDYILTFKVTDLKGNKTSVQESFSLDYGKK